MVSTTFRELGLSAPILRQLENLEYKTPTPIQAARIPLLLQNKDLMGLAQTGTGKTAAFALPLIQQLSERSGKPPGRRVRALILSPTRELAAQIHENIRAYARGLHLSTAVIFGGVGYASQFRELAGGLDILVATPGRLIDHLERRTVSLDGVETLILDEADHMLDMGFAPALKKIVSKIPRKRHTQMFSATMPDNIRQLAQTLLQKPETVRVSPPLLHGGQGGTVPLHGRLPVGKKAPYPETAETAGAAWPHAYLYPDQAWSRPPGFLPVRKGLSGFRHSRGQKPGRGANACSVNSVPGKRLSSSPRTSPPAALT